MDASPDAHASKGPIESPPSNLHLALASAKCIASDASALLHLNGVLGCVGVLKVHEIGPFQLVVTGATLVVTGALLVVTKKLLELN